MSAATHGTGVAPPTSIGVGRTATVRRFPENVEEEVRNVLTFCPMSTLEEALKIALVAEKDQESVQGHKAVAWID